MTSFSWSNTLGDQYLYLFTEYVSLPDRLQEFQTASYDIDKDNNGRDICVAVVPGLRHAKHALDQMRTDMDPILGVYQISE